MEKLGKVHFNNRRALLAGMASIFDLSPSVAGGRVSVGVYTPPSDDLKNLSRDWSAVGRYLSKSMRECNNE